MAEEFYKKYKNTYLTNNFRLRILGNKKKFQIEWRQMVAPSLSSRNNFLSITAKNYTEGESFQNILVLFNLFDFFT